MESHPIPPKPRSEVYRPELVRLPPLTPARRAWRRVVQTLVWLVVRLTLRLEVRSNVRLPENGPLLVVSNHLGDADLVVGLAVAKVPFDAIAKVELYDLPFVGWLLHSYGVIWVHRGQPDRKAIRAALDGLAEGRIIAIAPEGRESVIGALEDGTQGAAYLALKAGVPVLPVAVTGTENWRVYGNLKRLRRTTVTLNIGEPFTLPVTGDRKQTLQQGTEMIMRRVAALLPPDYRGRYRDVKEVG